MMALEPVSDVERNSQEKLDTRKPYPGIHIYGSSRIPKSCRNPIQKVLLYVLLCVTLCLSKMQYEHILLLGLLIAQGRWGAGGLMV